MIKHTLNVHILKVKRNKGSEEQEHWSKSIYIHYNSNDGHWMSAGGKLLLLPRVRAESNFIRAKSSLQFFLGWVLIFLLAICTLFYVRRIEEKKYKCCFVQICRAHSPKIYNHGGRRTTRGDLNFYCTIRYTSLVNVYFCYQKTKFSYTK